MIVQWDFAATQAHFKKERTEKYLHEETVKLFSMDIKKNIRKIKCLALNSKAVIKD